MGKGVFEKEISFIIFIQFEIFIYGYRFQINIANYIIPSVLANEMTMR